MHHPGKPNFEVVGHLAQLFLAALVDPVHNPNAAFSIATVAHLLHWPLQTSPTFCSEIRRLSASCWPKQLQRASVPPPPEPGAYVDPKGNALLPKEQLSPNPAGPNCPQSLFYELVSAKDSLRSSRLLSVAIYPWYARDTW